MSANLFGERYIGRKVAWHQLGTVFGDKSMTMTQAVKKANMDYNVDLLPVVAKDGRKQIEIANKLAIVREATNDDPQPRVFGVVSDKYSVIQNADIARIMDELSDEWTVETAGALGMGQTSFFTLKVPDVIDIKGDPIEQYFLISDKKTGRHALKVAFTPVRVVCSNTLTTGLAKASVLQYLSHRDEIEDILENRVKALKQMHDMQNQTISQFNLLAEAILTDRQINEIFAEAYPEPAKPKSVEVMEHKNSNGTEGIDLLESFFEKATKAGERYLYYKNLAINRRKDAKTELERINDEELANLPHLQNSAWATWQAVTAREDHRDGPESLYESALFGDRAKNKIRAFEKALVVAQR